MEKSILALVLIFSYSFSQTNKTPILLKKDTLLLYDTIFEASSKTVLDQQINEGKLQKEKIKKQLDSLNQLTPINLVYNEAVFQQIKFYILQRPEQVGKLLALSQYYFPVFEEYLDRHELPLELKYLPIIESSLNPHARSSAGAVGLWQFMYPTAKQYGLRINTYLDERKDMYKSTKAACGYLKKAYKVFQNWELAISSYNAGRGNITKAMRRSGGKFNYWEIRPFLPKETRSYIPSFIAAIYVMNFASDYGIKPSENYTSIYFETDSVFLKRTIKIEHLATILEIDPIMLSNLNPVYRISFVPSLQDEHFPVILPKNKIGVFIVNEDSIYDKLSEMALAEELNFPVFSDIEKIKHIVKGGDYLGKIAAQYNCTIKDIMLWNDLNTHTIKIGMKLSIYRQIK